MPIYDVLQHTIYPGIVKPPGPVEAETPERVVRHCYGSGGYPVDGVDLRPQGQGWRGEVALRLHEDDSLTSPILVAVYVVPPEL